MRRGVYGAHSENWLAYSGDTPRHDPSEAAILVILINHQRLLNIETRSAGELLVRKRMEMDGQMEATVPG